MFAVRRAIVFKTVRPHFRLDGFRANARHSISGALRFQATPDDAAQEGGRADGGEGRFSLPPSRAL
jgi:hypothetical protein